MQKSYIIVKESEYNRLIVAIRAYLAVSLLPFLMLFSGSTQDNKWKLVRSTGKMDIYTRKTDTALKEVKAVGTMDADLTSIITALNDVEAYTDWVYNCVESEQFEVVSEDEFHYYVKTHLPFPFFDRDLVVNTRQWIDNEGYWYSNSIAKPKMKPEKSRVVRIQHFYSLWKIKSISVTSVKFEYILSVNSGGILPAWIINIGIKKAPLSTIEALEKRAKELRERGG